MTDFFTSIFGTDTTPADRVKQWTNSIKHEVRTLDRELAASARNEAKLVTDIKIAAKKKDVTTAKILAKGLVKHRNMRDKLQLAKVNMNSIVLEMKQQLAVIKVTGVMQKSAQVMKCMSQIVKVSEVSEVMKRLSEEMMKAGIVSEMMDDAFEDQQVEIDAEEEVDKVLVEITLGQFGGVGMVGQKVAAQAEVVEENKEDEEDLKAMQARLQKLSA